MPDRDRNARPRDDPTDPGQSEARRRPALRRHEQAGGEQPRVGCPVAPEHAGRSSSRQGVRLQSIGQHPATDWRERHERTGPNARRGRVSRAAWEPPKLEVCRQFLLPLDQRTFGAVLRHGRTLIDSIPAVERSWLTWVAENSVAPSGSSASTGCRPSVSSGRSAGPRRGRATGVRPADRGPEVADVDGVALLPGAQDA